MYMYMYGTNENTCNFQLFTVSSPLDTNITFKQYNTLVHVHTLYLSTYIIPCSPYWMSPNLNGGGWLPGRCIVCKYFPELNSWVMAAGCQGVLIAKTPVDVMDTRGVGCDEAHCSGWFLKYGHTCKYMYSVKIRPYNYMYVYMYMYM